MKRILLSLFTISTFGFLSAQISFNTGDASFDADLNIINTNANKDLPAFKTDMTASFGVSISTVDNMLSMSMAPGEVYLALEIASVTKKQVSDVVVAYRKNKSKGWGVIAQELGIKPGSDEFHALKGKTKTKKDNGNGNNKSKGNSNK